MSDSPRKKVHALLVSLDDNLPTDAQAYYKEFEACEAEILEVLRKHGFVVSTPVPAGKGECGRNE